MPADKSRFSIDGEGRAVERRGVRGRRLAPNAESDWLIARDAHEPLVSRRTWEMARARREGKAASSAQRGVNPRTGAAAGAATAAPDSSPWAPPRARFALSGLCRCAACGARYEGYTLRSRRKGREPVKSFHYACGGYIRHGRSVCRLGAVNKEALEAAVAGAVLAAYEPFAGDEGRARLLDAVRTRLGAESTASQARRPEIESRRDAIERRIRALLDSISPANRDEIDRRLIELTREREGLAEELEVLDRADHSIGEAEAMADEAAAFLAKLEPTLRSASAAEVKAALRRCVRAIVIDSESRAAGVEINALPVASGGADAAVRRVDLRLPGRPRPRRSA